ncbi:hypothetical protein DL96DRAFT_1559345 [Flagelloscypha sp. PMI_526]|nr:hypothetical protein DL96DRAFT_1559345 [Flagelloscypha sp. PMI_526]
MVTLLDAISRLLGCVLIFSCVMFNIYPVGAARSFGITDADARTAMFMPALAARNGAFGVLVLSLSLTGQKRAIGMLWLAAIIPAVIDMRTCLSHGEKWQQHAISAVLFSILGSSML